jgi:WD40 repeat protein
MHDDQIRGLLRNLEDEREPDPAFADALFNRLAVVGRSQRRSRAPMLLVAAALVVALGASIAVGAGLFRLPVVVDTPATPTPLPSRAPMPSTTASAAPSGSPSPAPSAPEAVAELTDATLYATADGLRLRSEPSDGSQVVATLRAGQLMGATGQVASAGGMRWYEVRIGSGSIAGWITSGSDGDWLRMVGDGLIAYRRHFEGIDASVSVSPFGEGDVAPFPAAAGMSEWSWSPDGSRLAGSIDDGGRAPSEVVVIGADSSDLRRLGGGYSPVWSPDGSRLAWSGENDIVVTDENLVPHSLGLGLLRPTVARWSPDGTRLAITALQCPSCSEDEPIVGDVPFSIYVVNPDGSNLVRLTEPNMDNVSSWSADGSELSFIRIDLSGELPVRAFTVAADGGGEPAEQLGGTTAYAGYLWSPDGSRVAYATPDGIFVDAAGSGRSAVGIAPPDGTMLSELHWSPSGKFLLYGTSGDDGTSTLWITPADFGDPPQQIAPDDAFILQATWQPLLVELP